MEHLSHKALSSTLLFGISMLMLFFFCAPAHADNTPIPTFRSTSPYNRIGSTIDISATKIDPNSIGHQTYRSTIYTPFGNGTPSSNNPVGNSGSGGSGDSDDDVGIPGWADTPSEPLPIGDTAPLFLFAAAMIAIIFIKQRRQQLQSTTQSINTSNNNDNSDSMHTTRHISSNRLPKLFLLLAFVCIFAGQANADRTIYFRPSTVQIGDKSSWYHIEAEKYGCYIVEFHKKEGWEGWQASKPLMPGTVTTREQVNDVTKKNGRFISYTLTDEQASQYTRIAAYRWLYKNVISLQYGDYITGGEKRNPGRIKYSIPNGAPANWPSSAPIDIPDGVAYDGAPATLNLLVAREGTVSSTDNSTDYYWAHLTPAGSPVEIYFADINKWSTGTEDPIQLLTGKDIFTRCTSLEQIKNTRLWYKTFATEDRAFAYKFFGFVGNMNWWSGDLDISTTQHTTVSSEKAEGNKIATWIAKATTSTTLLQDTPLGVDATTGISLFTPGSANKNSTLNKETITSWTDLNHTHTITIETGGKLNYLTTWLTGAGSSETDAKANKKTGTITFQAAYTASVTLRAIPDDGYVFLGFYDAESNKLLSRGVQEPYNSDPITHRYTYDAPNSAQKIIAKFVKESSARKFQVRTMIYDGSLKDSINSLDGGTFTMTHSGGFTYTQAEETGYQTIYVSDAPMTLEATPKSSYEFIAWFNTDKDKRHPDNPWTIDDPTNTTKYLEKITAVFASSNYAKKQNINIEGPGTVEAGYFLYKEDTYKTTTFDKNSSFVAWKDSEVTLTANPLAGYKLDGWYEGENKITTGVDGNTLTYTADVERTITAKFKSINKLSVSVLNYNPEYDKFEEYGYEYNTVTLTQGGTKLKESYSSFEHTFNDETTVTLTATPEEGEDGYDFVGWYINNEKLTAKGSNSLYTLASDASTELTLNLSGAVAVNARFAPKKCYKIELINNLGGTYVVRYSKNQTFDQAVTKESSLDQSVYTYLPYGGVWMDVPITKPILGYKYKGYKIGGTFRDPDKTVNYGNTANTNRFMAHFVRSEDQVVYLHLINYKGNIAKGWENATKENCTYYAFVENSFYYYSNPRRTEWIKMEPIGDYCYRCTIPGGLYDRVNFVQAKETAPDINGNTELYVGYNNNENQHKRSGFVRIPATRHNCYRLGGIYSSTNVNGADAWTTPPTTTGDYRLIYIEQEVASKTEINRTYEFIDGDRVKKIASGTKLDTVSLHIYNKVSKDNNGNLTGTALNNPEIILQQWDGTAWVDVERYMVFGPLRSNNPGVIKMPNRKNTSAKIVVDKGIDNIMTDETDDGCGVWNFVIEQDGTTARLLVNETHRYTGNYYIRTPNADGQYNNFTHPGNIMSASEYAKSHSDYSHYFIRYVDIYEDGTPTAEAGKHPVVKFCIANDYAINLCKEFTNTQNRFEPEEDIYVLNAGDLPADATVRFGWDIKTNRLTRAYIANTFQKNNEYLVVEGTTTIGSPSGEATYFTDNSNHLYSIDLENATAGATAKVKAKMNGEYQYFMGGAQDEYETLISGNGVGSYPIRLLYDFKDDRFTTIYQPASGTINNDVQLTTPLMIERVHNYPATQIVLNTNKITTVEAGQDQFTQPAYAVMTFQESVLADASKTHHEKMFYWISFPFDVKISDVFGLGDYGKYWIMEEYDGAQRAQSGLAKSNWKYITKKSAVLSKNVGYVLCLNYSQILQDQLFKSYGGSDQELNSGKLSLYFPSNGIVDPKSIVGGQNATIDLAEYSNANTAWNHHNWHIIGVPSFANPGTIDKQQDAPFVYQYWHPGDAYSAKSINEVDFQSMHAYMVQYAGEITWTNKIVNTGGSVSGGKSLAAKTDEEADEKIMLRLELQQAGSTIDKTYVQLRNDKGTKGFDMSLDLTKIINAGANIYSIVDNHEMAGNAVPKEESIIPLGVVITAAGEYTLAMPNGTEGIMVELIDYEQGTSTNLLVGDYTVNMPVGTNNTRFALRLVPDKVATSVDNIGNEADGDKVRKLLIDGVLYLQQGTNTYDAQGKHVK